MAWSLWLLAALPGAVYVLMLWPYRQGSFARRERALALASRAQDTYNRTYRPDYLSHVAVFSVLYYVVPVFLSFVTATGLAA
jgi:hypothetical protein